MNQYRKNGYPPKAVPLFALLLIFALLTGCVAAGPSSPAVGTSSLMPSTPIQHPTTADWPQTPPLNAKLFQPHIHNGSLKVFWDKSGATDGRNPAYWIKDENGTRYYVNELDYAHFYAATCWIRVELTDAGRHYCDASWTVSMRSLTEIEFGDLSTSPFITVERVIPYYLDQNRGVLGGWFVYSKQTDPAVVELTLTGEYGAYTDKIWLAPSMANTYLDSPAFQVEVLEEKLELTQAEGNKYTTQWNGQVCYFENWFPNAVRNASCVMVLTPQQWLRDLEKEQTVSLAFHFMSFDILFDYAPKISGFYPLYADPEMTQWVAMYVFIGVENKESVGLTLYWTEEDGAQAFSKVIYYGGNDED